MCLGIPAKILSLEGDLAEVDFGDGTIRQVNVTLVDAEPGMYVIVHAGFAIQALRPEDAQETLKALEKYAELVEEKQQ